MLSVTSARPEVADQSHFSGLRGPNDMPDHMLAMENRLCPGCRKSAVNENGGLVVAFGQSFFHVDCFKCAKCGDQVTADTNLLLLSDGSPICANCSYSCNVCHQPILDEAIMTGDDSYHAHCFKCKVCSNRIDELVFAKTSQGIYCMNCHNERMAKIRKHAQKKKERERAAGGSGSSKSREREANEFLRERQSGSPALDPNSTYPDSSLRSKSSSAQISGSSRVMQSPITSPYTSKRRSIPHIGDAPEFKGRPSTPKSPPLVRQVSDSSTPPGPFSVTVAPPVDQARPRIHDSAVAATLATSSSSTSLEYLRSSPREQDTLALPVNSDSSGSSLHRRKSYDDGVRPLNVLLKQKGISDSVLDPSEENGSLQGLQIPTKETSRAEKRRSINPGLIFNPLTGSPSNASPGGALPLNQLGVNSHAAPVHNRDSPRIYSPLRERFPDSPNSRPASNSSTSSPSPLPSPSSSPAPPETDQTEHTQRSRAASSSTYLPRHEQGREPVDPLRPPLRPSVTLERVPPRSHSLNTQGPNGPRPPSNERSPEVQGRLSPGQGPRSGNSIRVQRSFDDRPRTASPLNEPSTTLSLDLRGSLSRSASRSRPTTPASPMHQIDVPHSIESGTDTEAEGDSGHGKSVDGHDSDIPPAPPPKETKTKPRPRELNLDTEHSSDADVSNISQLSSADDDEEGSAVERTSIAMSTFIAPALPPIRFSMTGADFSDLLKSVGGGSMKSLDQLGKLQEESPQSVFTPPPTANSFNNAVQVLTPNSDITILGDSIARKSSSDEEDRTVGKIQPPPSTNTSTVRSQTEEHDGSSPSASMNSFNSEQTLSKVSSITGMSDIEARKTSLDGSVHRSQILSGHAPDQSRARSSSESNPPSLRSGGSLSRRERRDSNTSIGLAGPSGSHSNARITITTPGSSIAQPVRQDTSDLVTRRLREALSDATDRGALQLKLDKNFVEAILMVVGQQKDEYSDLKRKLDGVKRASKHYMDGLTIAQTEYDQEIKAKRDAEAEVTRLRVLLSGQAARLTAMSGEAKRQEVRQQMSKKMSESLDGLERELSGLRVERDMTLAEVEELSASKSASTEISSGSLSRSLTMRLDNIKTQYQHELIPLTQQHEALSREIAELKAVRDVFLEETTALNARNEELAQLSAQYARRVEHSIPPVPTATTTSNEDPPLREKQSTSFDRSRSQPSTIPNSHSSFTTSSQTLHEDPDAKFVKIQRADVSEVPAPTPRPPKMLKWPGSKPKDHTREPMGSISLVDGKGKSRLEHSFQQLSVLRFARCDHCGDKMWGTQLRCSGCSIAVHQRCITHVHLSCSRSSGSREDPTTHVLHLPPSMFGRDLTEQVRADARGSDRLVPVIVEKCIEAVEAQALDYEGIYRKTGGSGQSKVITQLFERGDYNAFDLRDSDRFNDICSVTSVLKTYFRSLPVPLLTYDLHEDFMMAAEIRDPSLKNVALWELVNKLPDEHYQTLRMLMLHLHRVREQSEKNLMTARNLGVVFGPTLMRSRDPGAEFSDMAGKALSVEWLVENAATIFIQRPSSS